MRLGSDTWLSVAVFRMVGFLSGGAVHIGREESLFALWFISNSEGALGIPSNHAIHAVNHGIPKEVECVDEATVAVGSDGDFVCSVVLVLV